MARHRYYEAVYAYIVRYMYEYRGNAPSYTEISVAFASLSKSVISEIVDTLVDEGRLVRIDTPSRRHFLMLPRTRLVADVSPD